MSKTYAELLEAAWKALPEPEPATTPDPTGKVLPGPWPEIGDARRVVDEVIGLEWDSGVRLPEDLEKRINAAFARRDLAELHRLAAEARERMAVREVRL